MCMCVLVSDGMCVNFTRFFFGAHLKIHRNTIDNDVLLAYMFYLLFKSLKREGKKLYDNAFTHARRTRMILIFSIFF